MQYTDHRIRHTPKERIGIWRISRMIIICVIATIIISVQVYRLGDAFRYWWRNREVKKLYIQEISKLEQQQENMKEELHNLKYNTLTNERLAREMGYVKSGEIVYKFTPKSY